MTVFERFEETARKNPQEPAIVDEEERLTYGELLERVYEALEWLQHDLNPWRGDILAVSSPNTTQFIASFFAASGLGLVFMPCNTQWRSAELRWFAARLNFSAVIADPEFLAAWDEVRDLLPPRSVHALPDKFEKMQSQPGSPTHRTCEDSTAVRAGKNRRGPPRRLVHHR
jgi:acyl-CoA synthetase (AMP-forming)/AMP-acid ligase II